MTAPHRRSARLVATVAALTALSLGTGLAGCATEETAEEPTLSDLRAAQDDHESDPEAEVGQTSEELRSAVSCNKKSATAYRAGNAYPISLITVGGRLVSTGTGHAFLKMQKAAHEAGVYLAINSGFRSMAEQKYLYGCYLSGSCNNGNLAAKPGYSNHQSGVALDLSTSSWLANNAGKYGFKRTVPSENWHYEFTGKDPGGPCSASAKESQDLRFTAPLDEGVYHNDGLTFRTDDKSGKTVKVVYDAGNTKIGQSTDRKNGFAITYTFANLGNRRVTATSYDKGGKKLDEANIDVEITTASKPNKPDTDTSGKCFARCCDGTLTKELGAADGQVCLADSKKACGDHDGVKRVEQGGEQVWAREATCWAKCKGRLDYHQLPGVTKNCTEQVRDFCEEGDRGGLGDATWSECDPS